MRRFVCVAALVAVAGCSDAPSSAAPSSPPALAIDFSETGPLALPAGAGSFRFGAASAATQLGDQNPHTDGWVFTDDFEGAEGDEPRFGLYEVDYDPDERTPTEGAEVLGAIATARRLTSEQRATYGGLGPMTPDPEHPAGATFCDGR